MHTEKVRLMPEEGVASTPALEHLGPPRGFLLEVICYGGYRTIGRLNSKKGIGDGVRR